MTRPRCDGATEPWTSVCAALLETLLVKPSAAITPMAAATAVSRLKTTVIEVIARLARMKMVEVPSMRPRFAIRKLPTMPPSP